VIGIVDYGMGNLRSVEKALQSLGHACFVSSDPAAIRAARKVILPGVGAFGAAMYRLRAVSPANDSLAQAISDVARDGRPGLGMQLFFTRSREFGTFEGLDLIRGEVVRIRSRGDRSVKVPHMGWNQLQMRQASVLLAGVSDGAWCYFVHSYHCIPEDGSLLAATTDHGGPLAAAIQCGNVFATQYHPEKSGDVGLRQLDNFARLE
jgi:glutamine amidotransferase